METNATEPKNPNALDKAVKVSVIVGALLVALSVAYYLVIFLPQKEKSRIEQQKQEQQAQQKQVQLNKTGLTLCLAEADRKYWNYMELNGTKNNKTGVITAQKADWDTAEKNKQNAISNCYRNYPQN